MWRKRSWRVEVLRLYLGITLLGYGVSKIADPRFFGVVLPTAHAAAQGGDGPLLPIAPLSPFVAAGIGETVAAVLILSRRTWPLGALVGLAVLANAALIDLTNAVWRNETVMACLLLLATLLLLRLERERFARAVRALRGELPEPGEAPAVSTELMTVASRRAERRQRAGAVVLALLLFAGVSLLVDWATTTAWPG